MLNRDRINFLKADVMLACILKIYEPLTKMSSLGICVNDIFPELYNSCKYYILYFSWAPPPPAVQFYWITLHNCLHKEMWSSLFVIIILSTDYYLFTPTLPRRRSRLRPNTSLPPSYFVFFSICEISLCDDFLWTLKYFRKCWDYDEVFWSEINQDEGRAADPPGECDLEPGPAGAAQPEHRHGRGQDRGHQD